MIVTEAAARGLLGYVLQPATDVGVAVQVVTLLVVVGDCSGGFVLARSGGWSRWVRA
jgi:hypothetical protein